jgi:hypothetical protein
MASAAIKTINAKFLSLAFAAMSSASARSVNP